MSRIHTPVKIEKLIKELEEEVKFQQYKARFYKPGTIGRTECRSTVQLLKRSIATLTTLAASIKAKS